MRNLMPFLNKIKIDKNRIAYLASLTLLFSYLEMILPRFLPFFRFGFGNIAILLAFDLNFPSFFILTTIKSIVSCIFSGTLISPFFVISLFQSIFSGMIMFFCVKIFRFKLISIYGISLIGSAISAIIQILLSSFYLGEGTFSLLGLMMIFSVFSGILTAFFSQILKIPSETPKLIFKEEKQNGPKNFIFLILILIFAISTLLIKNIFILCGFLIISLILQKICKRKIMIIPHLSLWIFVIFSTLIEPNGKILFSIWKWNITQNALFLGIEKSLKLSTVFSLSQCIANVKFSGNNLICLVLKYFSGLNKIMQTTNGNILTKIKIALQAKEINLNEF